MVIPSLEEAERLYAEKKISKQRMYQIRHAHSGLCRFCKRAATHGVRCSKHAKSQAKRRQDAGAKKATCIRCGKKGHYQKTCKAVVQ